MEFPDLGQHCYESSCKQLDFLPMKCDSCKEIFCKDHITYTQHNCPTAYKKDIQVPVCPLCNQPVPIMRGEPPDIKVSEHIDRDCQSDPAKKKRKSNKCSLKGCKQKELIPVQCNRCQLNFCLRHRHEQDHDCKGFQGSGQGISRSGAAAVSRVQGASRTKPTAASKPSNRPQQTSLSKMGRDLNRERQSRAQTPVQRPPVNAYQAGLSEDEAMARALQLSVADSRGGTPTQPQSSTQESEDMELARAIAASEEEHRRQQQQQQRRPQRQQSSSSNKSSCGIC